MRHNSLRTAHTPYKFMTNKERLSRTKGHRIMRQTNRRLTPRKNVPKGNFAPSIVNTELRGDNNTNFANAHEIAMFSTGHVLVLQHVANDE